jgi:hypothetical protein
MELRWFRSWPCAGDWAERKIDQRPYVVDQLPKLIMSNYDYRTVGEFQTWPDDTPGFCMLEFDVALDPWQRHLFASIALMEPNEILVAPYRFHGSWSCWVGNDGSGPTEDSIQVEYDTEQRCDSFGFGCIYFPQKALQAFLAANQGATFTDSTFGKWYREHCGRARVCWGVTPQHLHEYNEA